MYKEKQKKSKKKQNTNKKNIAPQKSCTCFCMSAVIGALIVLFTSGVVNIARHVVTIIVENLDSGKALTFDANSCFRVPSFFHLHFQRNLHRK